ncbi:hypothetical protein AQUCO_00900960v1 [Aquilegia coerulea]|uniref:Uncharacterized protein n=1 Tax=Aquilegia coerulea TaxID=218851 RepID=A0A2G5EGN9_AQUCA|nr:hypothetical protein AQUCO_00900960v1 [Aquilegia coerulea]
MHKILLPVVSCQSLYFLLIILKVSDFYQSLFLCVGLPQSQTYPSHRQPYRENFITQPSDFSFCTLDRRVS